MARIIVPGSTYHVTHRGNRKGTVFFGDADREYYLYWLRQNADIHGVSVATYCLMTNHVHLVMIGESPTSLAKTIGQTHRRHACWINQQYGWTGHLWENRFYSSLLDEKHLSNAVRYVELNPVRAGLVARAEDYRWSSARLHCWGASDPLVTALLDGMTGGMEWSQWLVEGIPEDFGPALRRNTATGRPTAEVEFVRTLERHLGRPIHPRRRGRKTKKQGQLPNFGLATEIG